MIVIVAVVLGALLGDLRARPAQGNRKDRLQHRFLTSVTRRHLDPPIHYVPAAAAFVDGQPTIVEVESEVQPVPRSIGAINSVLRTLGVRRTDDADEFDSLGLGRFRSMEEWEDEDW